MTNSKHFRLGCLSALTCAFGILASALGSTAQLADGDRKKDGKVNVDAGDPPVFVVGDRCFFRAKGTFDCPIEDRDADVFVIKKSSARIRFDGKFPEGADGDEVAKDSLCACAHPANSNSEKWRCDCDLPGNGTAIFDLRVTCKGQKTGVEKEFNSASKTYKVKCK